MPGTVAFAMYVTSILLVLVVGFALRKTLWRTMGADPLVLDLPPYQVPKARLLLSVMWLRLKGFLHTASGIIVATVAVVWLLQATPVDGEARFGEVAVADSAYGLAAQAITPAFVPTGFAQWETTSALVVGFVAKEAVISSWAQTFAVADAHHDDPTSALAPRLRAAFATSSHGHTGPAVAAFMIFLLAYTPCVATLAAQQEGGRAPLDGLWDRDATRRCLDVGGGRVSDRQVDLVSAVAPLRAVLDAIADGARLEPRGRCRHPTRHRGGACGHGPAGSPWPP